MNQSVPQPKLPRNVRRALRAPAVFVFMLLAIEFLDEIVFGAREAAWPLVRTDLGLTYFQIGLLLSLPNLVSGVVEPLLGVLGDVWKRWALIVIGGFAFALASALYGLAPSFALLMVGSMIFYPASGAFVSLAQASLMDLDPTRHEHQMARWNLAGSLGVVAGPLVLGAAVVLGLGWRGLFIVFSLAALALTVVVWVQTRRAPPKVKADDEEPQTHWSGLRRAAQAARRIDVLRWLVLLMFSDFMLDVLLGFLALYMVDVVGVSPALAGVAVAVWSGVGLVGDALLIPLLERVRGLNYLRFSALAMLVLYPAFLLVPWYGAKLVLLALMGLGNAGWYAILKGQLYSALPGQSGTAMALDSGFGLVYGLVPALLGFIAQRAGLPVMMWVLVVGPLALLLGLPRVLKPVPADADVD